MKEEQIRKLLEEVQYKISIQCFHRADHLCEKALALLQEPADKAKCETCGDSGERQRQVGNCVVIEICPDCPPKPCSECPDKSTCANPVPDYPCLYHLLKGTRVEPEGRFSRTLPDNLAIELKLVAADKCIETQLARIAELEDFLKRSSEIRDEFQARITKLESQLRWIPVKSNIPKDGKEYLCCNLRQGGVLRLLRWDKVHRRYQCKDKIVIFPQDTHYFLPTLPGSEG